ncbi:MAG: hypothetical protein WD512_03860, partial [Candidatus Paceibacterota bacterium]
MNYFFRLFFDDLQPKSIVEILPHFLSRKQLRMIVDSAKDPRELVDLVFKLTNKKPDKFLKQLSSKINFPLLLNPKLEFP